MNRRLLISLLGGILISGAAMYVALRRVPLTDLIQYLRSINIWWMLPAGVLVMVSFLLRAYRWQIILQKSSPLSFWRVHHPMMIAFFLNCVLPGRAGDLARPMILQKTSRIPFSTGLATVALERMFDLFTLLLFFLGVTLTIQMDPKLSIPFGKYQLNQDTLFWVFRSMMQIGLVMIGFIALLMIPPGRRLFDRIIQFLPRLVFFTGEKGRRFMQETICARALGMVDQLVTGFLMVRHPMIIVGCMLVSFAIWGLMALSYFMMAVGFPGLQLSLAQWAAVMVIICFFISLPSAPGFWGLWEAGGVFALSLFGVPNTDAAGFILANHALQVLPVMAVGAICAVLTGVNLVQLAATPSLQASS